MEAIDPIEVRKCIVQYAWQSVRQAQVEVFVTSLDCRQLVDTATEIIIASNDGFIEFVCERVNSAPSRKRQMRWNGWRKLMRRAVSAYMDSLYVELDLAGAYLGHRVVLTCGDVLIHRDLLQSAAAGAKSLARARKRLFGWIFFAAA